MKRKYLLMKWSEIGLENDRFAINSLRHKHLIKVAEAIKAAKSKAMRAQVVEAIASRFWEGDHWMDPEYEYTVPKVVGQKRKATGQGASVQKAKKSKKKLGRFAMV